MTRFGNEGSPKPVPKDVIELVKAAPAPANRCRGLPVFIGQAA